MRYRVTALVAAATAAACLSASAADMPVKAPVAPAFVSYPSWAGFYVGAAAGWTEGSADGYYQGAPPPPPPAAPPPPMVFYLYGLRFDAANLGGYVGYNFQLGQWVVSAEGDLAWIGGGHDVFWDPGGSHRYDSVDLKWLAHARGRVGFAIGPWLPFFAGGAAFAGVRGAHLGPFGGGSTEWSASDTRTGYSLGAGIDYQLALNWLLRVEYLYDRFDTRFYDWVSGTRYSYADLTLNTFRIGITFRP